MKFKVLFIFLLIIGILLALLLNNFVNIEYEPYIRKFGDFKSDCDPFINNFSKYSVQIDNETYPTHIPLYQNKSINFKCLNTNTNTKLILFWNKFVSFNYY